MRQMLFSALLIVYTRTPAPWLDLSRLASSPLVSAASILATRQTSNLSSEPSDAQRFIFQFKVALQLQSSVRGYVWRDKFYGTVSNFWPLVQSEKDKSSKLNIEVVTPHICYVFNAVKIKIKKVVTPRDTLHIEPILHLGPVGLLRPPGDGRTVNAYVFISHHSSQWHLLILICGPAKI